MANIRRNYNMDFNKIVQIIADYKEMDVSEISESTLLAEDLELDSLDTVELIMSFEEELGVTLEMDQTIKTVGDVAALIAAAVKDA
jgi:acyl carrier protein